MSEPPAVDLAFEGKLLPAPPGKCPQCAVAHSAEMPHNAHSVFYNYSFYRDHFRWPNWGDALAHCGQEMKDAWRQGLRDKGVSEEELWAHGELPSGESP